MRAQELLVLLVQVLHTCLGMLCASLRLPLELGHHQEQSILLQLLKTLRFTDLACEKSTAPDLRKLLLQLANSCLECLGVLVANSEVTDERISCQAASAPCVSPV
jgi:hypothetical protein